MIRVYIMLHINHMLIKLNKTYPQTQFQQTH